jgi:hypothetical protein
MVHSGILGKGCEDAKPWWTDTSARSSGRTTRRSNGLLARIFACKLPTLIGEREHARSPAGIHKRDVIWNQAIDFQEAHVSLERLSSPLRS